MKSLLVLFLLMASAFAQSTVEGTPTFTEAVTKLHAHTHLGGTDKREWSVVIHEDGTASQPYSSNDYSANVLTVLLSDRAILHSHPDGASSQPSDRDIQTAKVVRMPNYEVSGYAVWVATPDGKTHKVAFIEQGKHGTITIKYTGAK